MDEIRELLKEYMGRKDLSVEQVAKKLHRHPLTIWKFLAGKTEPHISTLYKIKSLLEKAQ